MIWNDKQRVTQLFTQDASVTKLPANLPANNLQSSNTHLAPPLLCFGKLIALRCQKRPALLRKTDRQSVSRSVSQIDRQESAREHHRNQGSGAYLDLSLLQLGLSESGQSRPETQTQSDEDTTTHTQTQPHYGNKVQVEDRHILSTHMAFSAFLACWEKKTNVAKLVSCEKKQRFFF